MVALRPPPPFGPGDGVSCQNSFFTEHGHVAYQIKKNYECSNMVANFASRPQIPQDHKVWGQNVKIQLFQNIVMLHIKLKGITNAATG